MQRTFRTASMLNCCPTRRDVDKDNFGTVTAASSSKQTQLQRVFTLRVACIDPQMSNYSFAPCELEPGTNPLAITAQFSGYRDCRIKLETAARN